MTKVDPYLHAVLVLYGLGKEITPEAITKVVEAAGGKVDQAKANVLVEALKDVNIEEAIEQSQTTVVAAAAPQQPAKEEKKEEKKEEESEEKKEEEAAAGLASLFG